MYNSLQLGRSTEQFKHYHINKTADANVQIPVVNLMTGNTKFLIFTRAVTVDALINALIN